MVKYSLGQTVKIAVSGGSLIGEIREYAIYPIVDYSIPSIECDHHIVYTVGVQFPDGLMVFHAVEEKDIFPEKYKDTPLWKKLEGN